MRVKFSKERCESGCQTSRFICVVILSILLSKVSLHGQKTTDLYPAGSIPNEVSHNLSEVTEAYQGPGGETRRFISRISRPELTIYLPAAEKRTGIGIVICPGGGYTGVAIDHEGHRMAERFNEAGIAAFVLKYRMPLEATSSRKELAPLQDAQRALQYVRQRASEWSLDPDRIGIAGSSAGGHLASTAGTHFQEATIPNPEGTSLRPDFMVLNYPVISFADSLTHEGSRRNLIGEQDTDGNWVIPDRGIATYSNELRVTPDTPPAFVTHAVDDAVVKVQNSVLFIAALQQQSIPVASFFYANGGHGYGMVNPTAENQWMDPCIRWILDNFGDGN